MTEAEKLFTQVWQRWTNRQSFLLSFRLTARQGMEAAREKIAAEKVTFVNAMLEGGDYDKIFIDKAAFFKAMPPDKLVETMTDETVRHAEVGVDAASIVFAHSFLDGAVFDYCRVTALAAPRDWESVLDQRQIKISEVRELKYEDLLRKKLDEYFEQLERESLVKKADLLFARCKPPQNYDPMHGYTFDRDRLLRLDEYRHQIIHGDNLGKGIANAEEEVDFLMRTVLFFMGMVNLRYGIQLDPYYAMTGQELPAAAKGGD